MKVIFRGNQKAMSQSQFTQIYIHRDTNQDLDLSTDVVIRNGKEKKDLEETKSTWEPIESWTAIEPCC